ncbi:MAG: AsmA family protein, partial [Alphaproteobacteria bacterium]|nr:AsmA family protein [Alphaproteobacteria bacterium]
MKKLGLGFTVLIVILTGVILVVPGFLNWNKYKGQIERTASYYSGRTVTIKGDISLSLLPTSALSAKDVTVANLKNGRAEHMISLKSLNIKVSFPSVIASLFGGKLKVEKLILVDPVIALEVLKDGRKNWDLTKASGPEETNTSADISLEKFQIINGQISFENMSSGRRELLGKINANIRAKSIRGPFVVTGRAKYRGLEAKISLDLGKDRSGNRIPVTAKIALLNGQLKAAAIGGVILNGKDSAYSGKLKITASDVGNFFGVFDRLTGRKLPGTISFGQDFALDTRIAVSANKATARNLTFRMGQSRGQGRAEISLSAKIKGAKINFLTQLTVNKLDLDKLLTALNGPARGIADHRPRDIPAGNRVKPDWLNRVTGKADISLGALRYNGKI